jgi:alpha-tubulin suppressor-like RCC1 family protein
VSAGGHHSCALLSSGSVQCWGNNSLGQLGNSTANHSSVPVTVSGITTAKAITSGYLHSCALLSNNSVVCSGFNQGGELGNGTTTDSYTPIAVKGL